MTEQLMLNPTKALIIVLSIISRLFFGFIPLFMKKKFLANNSNDDSLISRMSGLLISFCWNLGGGVLLATCFTHLIPHVRESLERDTAHWNERIKDCPLTELVVCLGFFLVYFVEETVKYFVSKHKKHIKLSTTHNCDRLLQWTNSQLTAVKSADDVNSVSVDHGTETPDCHIEQNNNEMSHVHNLRSLFFVLAISFHSLIEGLAIGLEKSMDNMGFLFLAISIHECTILFCHGVTLVSKCSSLTNIVFNIIFLSLISPFGIFLGTLLTLSTPDNNSYHSIVNSTLQGLAAGTILYVTFFEVFDRERKKDTPPGLLKLLFTMIGFFFMFSLEMFGGHHHHHQHDHSISSLLANSSGT